jgi:hypothetical protein
MLRNILGLIAGYAIFVIAAVLLFQLSGVDPHSDPSISFLLGVIACGIVSSITGGFVAQQISKDKKLTVNYILALIIAGFATFSYFKTTGNHYSQIAAIFLFAPFSILGGYFVIRKHK